MTQTRKKYKLKDVIGMDWEKVPEYPRDTCDFCLGPIYNDGHWQSKGLAGRNMQGYTIFVACKACARAAGLEW